jgi:glycosyltransferase involved in cell wall biosynthesis
MIMPYTFASQSGNLAHAFGLGIPVVVSGLEGLKAEVEASGAGIQVPPESDEDLKRAIISLILDDTLREKYSANAIRYVKKEISWNNIVKKYLALYKKLIIESKKPISTLHAKALLEEVE